MYFIILKAYDQQFTLTTKKSLHIIFKARYTHYPCSLAVLVKARCHYAIQVADLVEDLVSDLSQIGSSYLDMSR